jgi:uncharacterized protein with HEPN domain
MELKIQKYLYDIITSIDSIYEYLGEKRDFSIYQNNKLWFYCKYSGILLNYN